MYKDLQIIGENVYAIGWLGESDYSTGLMDGELVRKLIGLLSLVPDVLKSMGAHDCHLCDKVDVYE